MGGRNTRKFNRFLKKLMRAYKSDVPDLEWTQYIDFIFGKDWIKTINKDPTDMYKDRLFPLPIKDYPLMTKSANHTIEDTVIIEDERGKIMAHLNEMSYYPIKSTCNTDLREYIHFN